MFLELPQPWFDQQLAMYTYGDRLHLATSDDSTDPEPAFYKYIFNFAISNSCALVYKYILLADPRRSVSWNGYLSLVILEVFHPSIPGGSGGKSSQLLFIRFQQ